MVQRRIVFHLTPDGLEHWRHASRYEFYRRLYDLVSTRGVEVVFERMTQSRGTVPWDKDDGDLHFVHGGSVNGSGWLNSSLAYLPGFWHVNTVGILADSPARNNSFEAHAVKRGAADKFFEGLHRRFAEPRSSRYRQEVERSTLPNNCVAVFLQGRYPYSRKQNYMTMEEMIKEVVGGTPNNRVVVKPHPLEKDYGMEAIREVRQAGYCFDVTDANVHDILDAAVVVASVNSSVCFEGFMHRKPSVVFGRTDFQSLVETVRAPGQFGAALATARDREWDFAAMLHWYFKNHTIRVRSSKFERLVALQVERSGVEPAWFGLSSV
jgi:Capsule polysaccharide biosynthesis protein